MTQLHHAHAWLGTLSFVAVSPPREQLISVVSIASHFRPGLWTEITWPRDTRDDRCLKVTYVSVIFGRGSCEYPARTAAAVLLLPVSRFLPRRGCRVGNRPEHVTKLKNISTTNAVLVPCCSTCSSVYCSKCMGRVIMVRSVG